MCSCQHCLCLAYAAFLAAAAAAAEGLFFTKPVLKEAEAMEPEQTGTMFVFLGINWRVVEETRQMLQEVAPMASESKLNVL